MLIYLLYFTGLLFLYPLPCEAFMVPLFTSHKMKIFGKIKGCKNQNHGSIRPPSSDTRGETVRSDPSSLLRSEGRIRPALQAKARTFTDEEAEWAAGTVALAMSVKSGEVRKIIEDSDNADVTLIEEAIEDIGDVAEIAGQSPIIRLVNYIIFNAVKEGASDIHIEPAEHGTRVRYRIDGKLHKALEVPLHLLNAITSRIKIMASMDISERRLPQDGRVHVLLEGRKIDLVVEPKIFIQSGLIQ